MAVRRLPSSVCRLCEGRAGAETARRASTVHFRQCTAVVCWTSRGTTSSSRHAPNQGTLHVA